ncbi:unnamed protein product [Pleuronectes platessa]|uniref:Uncharacterized protein n=1 Tax=Pleuronectes platessa TaxID=8262 RepID=A0A9N7Y4T4_PLEPL|nr:unnamed protein product [Pleuronectes platessa]
MGKTGIEPLTFWLVDDPIKFAGQNSSYCSFPSKWRKRHCRSHPPPGVEPFPLLPPDARHMPMPPIPLRLLSRLQTRLVTLQSASQPVTWPTLCFHREKSSGSRLSPLSSPTAVFVLPPPLPSLRVMMAEL